MRGKPVSECASIIDSRITPADAGKTPQSSNFILFFRDHPRGCGENANVAESIRQYGGSPPRMRGKPLLVFGFSFPFRITPADAGKTPRCPLKHTVSQDHPRGCGENCPYGTSYGMILGSPPRMRGKPTCLSQNSAYVRITPADAGKT